MRMAAAMTIIAGTAHSRRPRIARMPWLGDDAWPGAGVIAAAEIFASLCSSSLRGGSDYGNIRCFVSFACSRRGEKLKEAGANSRYTGSQLLWIVSSSLRVDQSTEPAASGASG